MADTSETLEDEIIDPTTGEIIERKELAERSLAPARSGPTVANVLGIATPEAGTRPPPDIDS